MSRATTLSTCPPLETRETRFQPVEGFAGALGTAWGHHEHYLDGVERYEHGKTAKHLLELNT